MVENNSLSHVFIGLGSNLGDKEENVKRAIDLIAGLGSTKVIKSSSFYKTSPVGIVEQDWFLNAVIKIRTDLSVKELMRSLIDIESKLKRIRRERWGPRTIDLDILFFDDIVIDEEGITVPHPRLHERRFVLAPFKEIEPDFVHPLLEKSIRSLYDELKVDEEVVRL